MDQLIEQLRRRREGQQLADEIDRQEQAGLRTAATAHRGFLLHQIKEIGLTVGHFPEDPEMESWNAKIRELQAEIDAIDAKFPQLKPSAIADNCATEPVTDFPKIMTAVLSRLRTGGLTYTAALDDWLEVYGKNTFSGKRLSKTSVTDYVAGRIKGEVSSEKCRDIENAIRYSAKQLGVSSE